MQWKSVTLCCGNEGSPSSLLMLIEKGIISVGSEGLLHLTLLSPSITA